MTRLSVVYGLKMNQIPTIANVMRFVNELFIIVSDIYVYF